MHVMYWVCRRLSYFYPFNHSSVQLLFTNHNIIKNIALEEKTMLKIYPSLMRIYSRSSQTEKDFLDIKKMIGELNYIISKSKNTYYEKYGENIK